MVPRELRGSHRFAQSAERRKPHEVDASREAVESFARQGRRGQIRLPRGRAVAGHRDCEDRGARTRGREGTGDRYVEHVVGMHTHGGVGGMLPRQRHHGV